MQFEDNYRVRQERIINYLFIVSPPAGEIGFECADDIFPNSWLPLHPPRSEMGLQFPVGTRMTSRSSGASCIGERVGVEGRTVERWVG